MSETKKSPRPSGGKPSGARRGPYGKPAGAKPAAGRKGAFGKPSAPSGAGRGPYGKPAAGKPEANRSGAFGKPSTPSGVRRGPYGKPADGKPETGSKSAFGKPSAPSGARRGPYGKPSVGRPQGARRAPSAKPAEMEGLAARRLALRVIREVTEQGAYASLSLDKALRGCGLIAADRRLASRLAYDTLDRMIWLDYVLSQVMSREDTDIKLRNILRLGACQILVEDRIPESAATNTCVALCAELGMEGLKGVCNGILRNLIRKKDELVWPDPETEPEKAFSLRCSLPEWLGRRILEEYGPEEGERIAAFRRMDAPICIRMNPLRQDEASFEALLGKKIWGREKSDLPGVWRITGAMDIAMDTDFLAGHFSIQSESSHLACLAMDVRRGMRVLDCCAAPGGKTVCLAEKMGGTGRVQAWDIHEHRVALIEAQARRLGLENIRPVVRDATRPREDLIQSMDAVLLDAPCSGLGVMAEKPDLKLRVTEEGVRELTELQARLLDTVCEYVRPGGTLVYSTCSVLREENEEQISAFLDKHPEFAAEKLPASIPERYRQHERTGLQLLEYRDGTEGFYICRMRRKA